MVTVPSELIKDVRQVLRSPIDPALLPSLNGGTVRIAHSKMPSNGGVLVGSAYLTLCARVGAFVAVRLNEIMSASEEVAGYRSKFFDQIISDGLEYLIEAGYGEVFRINGELFFQATFELRHLAEECWVRGGAETSV